MHDKSNEMTAGLLISLYCKWIQVSIELGTAKMSEAEMVEFVESLKPTWQPHTYHVFDRNCVHFADLLSLALLSGSVDTVSAEGSLCTQPIDRYRVPSLGVAAGIHVWGSASMPLCTSVLIIMIAFLF